MITYPAMNAMIVNLLRMTDEPDKLYAAQRIEELELELKSWAERKCKVCKHWTDYSPSIWGVCSVWENRRCTATDSCPMRWEAKPC